MRKIIVAVLAVVMGGTLLACDPPAPVSDFPNASNTGADETVTLTVIDHDVDINVADTTMTNVRLTNCSNITVNAPNFHLSNAVFEGGRVSNQTQSSVHNGMVISHATFENRRDSEGNIMPHNDCRVGAEGDLAND